MQRIFISYRREDTAGHAGRLFDRLRARFGKDAVFMDVEGIEAGVDFVEAIERAVGACDVLLAVIGRGWLDCKDARGRRRLEDAHDFISLETATALKRGIRVIPVLVEGAPMPPTDALPEALRPLTRRQAVELRDNRWEADVDHLVQVLENLLASPAAQAPAPPAASQAAGDSGAVAPLPATRLPTPERRGIWLGAAAVILVGLIGEKSREYSARMASVYQRALREQFAARIEVQVRGDSAPAKPLIDGDSGIVGQLCANGTGMVYGALAQQVFAISPAESAHWPELRMAAYDCASGRRQDGRYSLSPHRDDTFPFARDMAQAMTAFIRDSRSLRQ